MLEDNVKMGQGIRPYPGQDKVAAMLEAGAEIERLAFHCQMVGVLLSRLRWAPLPAGQDHPSERCP